MPLLEAQATFAGAVLDPESAIPPHLISAGRSAGEDRFAVYRNNVMVGLTEALRDAYPVVARLVGEEFFRAMASVFARSHPPLSPVMLKYGQGFPEWIAGFPPAASVPYLPDVARLERAWIESYHSPDADPIDTPPGVAAGEAQVWLAQPVQLHPATRLVRSPHQVFTIWRANLPDAEPGHLRLSHEGENVLITRPAAEVQACCISDGAAELIEAAQKTGGEVARWQCGLDKHLPVLTELGAFAVASTAAPLRHAQ